MITLQVKSGKRILPDTAKFRYGLTVGEFKAYHNSVNEAFFDKLDVTLVVQTSNTYSRGAKRNDGTAYCWKHLAMVWTQKHNTLENTLHTTMHELGHLYHYMTDYKDFTARTDYGCEIYAEEFSHMALGNMYNVQYRTWYPAYEGYKEGKIYNISDKQWIRAKIKPLTAK